MKIYVLRLFILSTKLTIYGVALQCIFLSTIFAKSGLAQKAKSIRDVYIDLSIQDGDVFKFFKEIESKTDFVFAYDKNDFANVTNIDIQKRAITVADALMTLSKEANLKFTQVNNYINVNTRDVRDKKSIEVIIQGKTITGKVTSAEDQGGLPGVNVMIKGTGQGTITDVEGNYVVEVPDENATLVFSYVGYVAEEVAVGIQSVVDIALVPDITSLDEIVVVGYATKRKADLTGAVSVVSGEALTVTSNTSVASILQGKLSGINITKSGRPGSGSSFNVRGIGSFGSGVSNSPLIIIDGVPVQGGIETLNPNDIESVNLLKDAASAAIYGSRAANGVIIITTKAGREGVGKINVNFFTGTQSPTRKIDMLSPEQFLDAAKEGISNQEFSTGNDIVSPLETATYEDLGHVDWVEKAFSSAPVTNLSISTSGGSQKAKYYISGEYLNQDGIGPESGYDKISARANLDANVTKWLRIGNNLHVSQQVQEGAGNGQQASLTMTGPYWDEVRNDDGTLAGPNALGLAVGQKGNPLIGYEVNNINTTWLRFLDNFYAEVEFIENLKLKFNAAYDLTYENYKNYQPKYNIGGAQRDRNQYQEYRDFNNMWMTEFILSYAKTLGNHNMSGMVAHSRQLYTTDNDMHGLVKDFASDAENMQVLSGGTNREESDITGSKSELAIASYFGRLSYDYKSKYLINFNLRVDGSSRFTEDNRWGVFPSISGAWKIHEEGFFGVDNIANLKLRASWGQLGNQSVGSYYPTSVAINQKNVVFGPNNNQKLHAGYVQDGLANERLEWETTTIANIGIDIGLFDGRLAINADYFNKVTDGILRGMVIPKNVGLGAPTINFAKVKNSGADFEITYKDNVGDLNFSVGFNASHVKNEIMELSEGIEQELGSLPWNGQTINKVGESLNSFYGYITDGLFTTQTELDEAPAQPNKRLGLHKYVDINEDGKIDADDMTVLGNSIPKWNLGSTITADWKNFDFMMVWMAILGRDQHQAQQLCSMYPPGRNMPVDRYNNRWQFGQPYEEGMYPSLYWTNVYQGSYDALFIKNGFARMRTISIGYTYNFKDKVSARLFFTGENLITITSDEFLGIDPENNYSEGRGTYLVWGDGFPNPKIYMIGLNLNF
ncbi:MAG: TonB-dependent receptor [Cytophagales bacterium]|nr:TonB-dependent receptor [Cytophagales bacterium]